MTEWRLYYGDRSTFSSEDGDWADAPFLDVAALAVPEPGVKRQVMADDFYVHWNQTPHSSDFVGLLDYLRHVGGATLKTSLSDLSLADLDEAGVKVGRMYPNSTWRDLWAWVVADADETWG